MIVESGPALPHEQIIADLPCLEISRVSVRFFSVTRLLEYIIYCAGRKEGRVITYANVQTVNLAANIPWFRGFLKDEPCMVYCDGVGLVLGARILGSELGFEERATAPDFFERLAIDCEEKGLALYLLAGKPGVTDLAIAKLKQIAPGLRVCGQHGYFNKKNEENDAVLKEINDIKPDIVCIGFGSPLQESWIKENRARLNVPLYLCLGAWLDFYTGTTWRGPRFLTDHGAEWLCRLFTEPRRLWKRYLVGIPQFLFRVLCDRLKAERNRLAHPEIKSNL